MHQSFATTAPMGPGNSGDIDFSLHKALVNALHCGDNFLGQIPGKGPCPPSLHLDHDNYLMLYDWKRVEVVGQFT